MFLFRVIRAVVACAALLGLGASVAESAEATRVAQLFRLHSAEAGSVTVEWEPQAVRDAVAEDGALVLREFPLRSDLSVDLRVETFTVIGPNTRFLSGARRAARLRPLGRRLAPRRGRRSAWLARPFWP